MKLEFSRHIFEKKKYIQIPDFMKILPCGQMDRHDEVNNRFSQICERAQKKLLKINTLYAKLAI